MYKASPELSFFLLPSLSAEVTGVPHHARCQAIEPLSQGQALSCVALTTELKALFSLKLVRTDGDNTHTHHVQMMKNATSMRDPGQTVRNV